MPGPRRAGDPLADSGAGAGFEAVLAAAAYQGIEGLAPPPELRRLAGAVLRNPVPPGRSLVDLARRLGAIMRGSAAVPAGGGLDRRFADPCLGIQPGPEPDRVELPRLQRHDRGHPRGRRRGLAHQGTPPPAGGQPAGGPIADEQPAGEPIELEAAHRHRWRQPACGSGEPGARPALVHQAARQRGQVGLRPGQGPRRHAGKSGPAVKALRADRVPTGHRGASTSYRS